GRIGAGARGARASSTSRPSRSAASCRTPCSASTLWRAPTPSWWFAFDPRPHGHHVRDRERLLIRTEVEVCVTLAHACPFAGPPSLFGVGGPLFSWGQSNLSPCSS